MGLDQHHRPSKSMVLGHGAAREVDGEGARAAEGGEPRRPRPGEDAAIAKTRRSSRGVGSGAPTKARAKSKKAKKATKAKR